MSHWTPQRWERPSRAADASRATCVASLVQELADAAAAAEGRPPQPVPQPENSLALPDQLRVMVADLVKFGDDEALRRATALITATAGLL